MGLGCRRLFLEVGFGLRLRSCFRVCFGFRVSGCLTVQELLGRFRLARGFLGSAGLSPGKDKEAARLKTLGVGSRGVKA